MSKILLYKNQNQCKNSTNMWFLLKIYQQMLKYLILSFLKKTKTRVNFSILEINTTKSDFKLKKGDLPVTKSTPSLFSLLNMIVTNPHEKSYEFLVILDDMIQFGVFRNFLTPVFIQWLFFQPITS